MANFRLIISILFIFSSLSISAKTSLKIVKNFNIASDSKIWKNVKKYQIPSELLGNVVVENPEMAYRSPFNKIFLQNKYIVVCNVECNDNQNINPTSDGSDNFVVDLSNSKKKKVKKIDQSIIRQMTVYYWVNQTLERMDELGYRFDKRLIIRVDREVTDPSDDSKSENNAFFMPLDWTLSFLPAHRSLSTKNIRSSAYDPSVAIHETAHFIFAKLTEKNTLLNSEANSGYNEGFADYMAMTILNASHIGNIMMGGATMRDASKLLNYEPQIVNDGQIEYSEKKLESHALGNVFAAALWNIRALFSDKDLADKIVVEATRSFSADMFAHARNYPKAYLSILDSYAPNFEFKKQIVSIWEKSGLIDKAYSINLDAIPTNEKFEDFVSLSLTTTSSDKIHRQYNIPYLTNIDISLVSILPGEHDKLLWFLVSVETTTTSTPVWLYVDMEKDLIIGAYDYNKNIVSKNDTEFVEALKIINENTGEVISFVTDFAEMFRDISLNKKSKSKYIYKAKKAKKTDTYVNINGSIIPAHEYDVKIRRTILNKLAAGVFKRTFSSLKSLKEIKIYTVDKSDLDTEHLPIYKNDELFVGYKVILNTGLTSKVMIKTIAQ